MNPSDKMNDIVSLSKRRGFVYPSSEIYGGLANAYEYGPLGVELKRNLINLWWKRFITQRPDMVGLDSSIILHPKTWEASGHVGGFSDPLIDCKECQRRKRADHLIEEYYQAKGEEKQVEGLPDSELDQIIQTEKIPCPYCGGFNWTNVRQFNLLFETSIGIVPETESKAYLRGETAQGIFTTFKNILDSTRVKLPFGVGQTGKGFRNEITLGNFIFRTMEFEMAEIEYFFDPENSDWEAIFGDWQGQMWQFVTQDLGISPDNLRWREHPDEERSFYSRRTVDLDYNFPFGFKELWGLAYRTDYDLKQHMEYSGQDLQVVDSSTGRKFLPHVIEPAVGVNRLFLMILLEAFYHDEENQRIVLRLPKELAPYRAAVFPLLKNKPELVAKADEIFKELSQIYPIAWDDRGNIGKRYLSQDEIGTPTCITIDFQTLEDGTVTLRDRDSMEQIRVPVGEVVGKI
jgi:glycyl-tRNA synthetase